MNYDNYQILHIGRGSADKLGTIQVSTELFDKFKDRDWQIKIGGGWNGGYYLVPLDEDLDLGITPLESPNPQDGIKTLPELVMSIQFYMNHDQGNYISHDWLKSLPKEDRPAVLNVVRLPILNYGGEQPGSREIESRKLALLS